MELFLKTIKAKGKDCPRIREAEEHTLADAGADEEDLLRTTLFPRDLFHMIQEGFISIGRQTLNKI